MGNVEFILELVRKYPERVLELNDNKQSIFHVAVLYRHVNIYPLLYDMGSIKESIIKLEDIHGNNMLHLVGILEETSMCKELEDMSQIYAQMAEELRWFKVVNAMIPPSLRVKKNKAGLSPLELFIENHKVLVYKSQEWMKRTFSELLLLAALMITISFAAAISFASGSNQDSNRDTAAYKVTYNLFIICNGSSFIFALSSIILMLSIMGSRHAEHDFLESLPRNLDNVIYILNLSMGTMMIAFQMIIILLYHDNYSWVVHVTRALACIVCLWFGYRVFTHATTRTASCLKVLLLYKRGIMYKQN
ncbi:hypothetical protein OSB04_007131 [Centaurea solstitialis]|uniref:PGG domain-containing protein n=1 Tax=Centaurea solstitialis TaxID=347529 RepID=A0AA38TUU4_9ASTR|nr:hypothetical protein OSB04_007131 [Centaurea solstitialis]